MKRFLFLPLMIGTCLLTAHRLSAQCPSGSYVLNSQQDLDAFACSVVDGNLTININTVQNVDLSPLSVLTSITGDLILQQFPTSDLTAFNSLTSIGGDLRIEGIETTNIDGFASLVSVGGDVDLYANFGANSINGFPALNWVGGDVNIRENLFLTALNGFTNLDSVGGFFSMNDQPALTQLNGFANLRVVEGDFLFILQEALTQITVFSQLTTVGGNFKFSGNPALTDASGLSNLNSIGGSMEFGSNDGLTHVDFFSSLTRVGGSGDGIIFQANDALTNLDGLSNLTSAAGYAVIEFHPVLTDFCGLYPLVSSQGSSFFLLANGNAVNPSVQDIINGGLCANYCNFNSDTTYFTVATCDPLLVGEDTTFLTNAANCDSLIITSTILQGGNSIPVILDDDLSEDPILLLSSGTLVSVSGSFSEGCGDTHTITVDWGDEDASNAVTTAIVDEADDSYSSTYTYTQTGIYLVSITITDAAGNSSSYTAENNVLIYNPICGSARMAASYDDPNDGLAYHVFARARYNGQGQIEARSGFRFYRRGQGGQNSFYFRSTDVSAMVISGNTASITGQGRYLVQGSGGNTSPTHAFSLSFQDVAQNGQTDQIQSLMITELATGNVVYDLSSAVNVWSQRVRVNNTANCRVGQTIDELDDQIEVKELNIFPNPFQASTQIPYELNTESQVSLSIYDMQGRVIRKEDAGRQTAGSHSFKWNATNQQGQEVAAGIYIVKLQIDHHAYVKQVVYRPR